MAKLREKQSEAVKASNQQKAKEGMVGMREKQSETEKTKGRKKDKELKAGARGKQSEIEKTKNKLKDKEQKSRARAEDKAVKTAEDEKRRAKFRETYITRKDEPDPKELDKWGQCPLRALALFHANSGGSRFRGINKIPRSSEVKGVIDPQSSNVDEWMSSKDWSEEETLERRQNARDLVEEIRQEKVTDEEKVKFIETYEKLVGKDKDLLTCACCGMREMQRPDVLGHEMEHHRVSLDDPIMNVLRLTNDEKNELEGDLSVEVEVPVDSKGTMKTIRPSEIRSYYRTKDGSNYVYYHLHREFVEESAEESKPPTVLVCPSCFEHLDGENKPPLSIAAGVDYGNIRRLQCMTPLNLFERAMLATVRQYKTVVKMQVTRTVERRILKSHAVTFDHDAPNKVVDLLDPKGVCERIQLFFVGPNGEVDDLAKSTFGHSKITGRAYVLLQ